jgi:hypothetical protein
VPLRLNFSAIGPPLTRSAPRLARAGGMFPLTNRPVPRSRIIIDNLSLREPGLSGTNARANYKNVVFWGGAFTAPALRIYHSVDSVNSVDFFTIYNSKWVWGVWGGLGGFGGVGGVGGGAGGGGRLRQHFFGLFEKRGDALLLKLRAGLIEVAGYCLYSLPQIRYVCARTCTGQPKTGCKTHGNRPWADAMGSTPKTKNSHGGCG